MVEQWTSEIWTAVIAAFVVGLIVGFIVVRMTKGNVKQQIRLENDLKAAKTKIEEQKQQLEKHFEHSASLLSTLAEDYKKLYNHLAQGSETLLPEANRTEFFKQPQLTITPEKDNNPPRDYSEGSSGLLKS